MFTTEQMASIGTAKKLLSRVIKWDSFPERSSSSGRVSRKLVPSLSWFRPRRVYLLDDRRSRWDFLLLHRHSLIETEEVAPQVGHKFGVKAPLRQLKQTGYCWLFNSWRAKTIPPSPTKISTD